MGTRRLLAWSSAGALVLLLAVSAWAQLSVNEQKCIDCYNNNLRLVGQQAGKDYRVCIKKALKGLEPNPDGCVTADTPGNIAGKATKVNACYTLSLKCTGAEPIQQGAPGTTGINAMIGASQDLVHDVFGDPIVGLVTGTAEAKCADKAYKRSEELFTQKLKTFRKCKKDNMKLGLVTGTATLEVQCMTPTIPDPALKIIGRVFKLTGDVNAVCAGLPLAALFPGACSASASTADLGTCLERRVECRVCQALNAADGMLRDCDLFDDGVANGSCT